MPDRVEVRPELLRWARERARLGVDDLIGRFPKLAQWEAGTALPTLRQLEAYAHTTHAPFGFLLLDAPPDERVPIPDFRTRRRGAPTRPSANLLATIYACQQRQYWYHDHLVSERADPLPFVGSVRVGADVVTTARTIATALDFDLAARRQAGSWEQALTDFVARAEAIGVLVMRNGVVGNNTHRKLDIEEFRGFTLVDPLAPLVFINAADTKSAQMFTLAHELVHVWSGESGLGDESPRASAESTLERWCDAVAAELLVPTEAMQLAFNPRATIAKEVQRLARQFKVSTLVILRRARDIGAITEAAFHSAYDAELDRLTELGDRGSSGGNFYLTEAARVSPTFARALITSALEGVTLERDALRMLDIRTAQTFHNVGQAVGAPA